MIKNDHLKNIGFSIVIIISILCIHRIWCPNFEAKKEAKKCKDSYAILEKKNIEEKENTKFFKNLSEGIGWVVGIIIALYILAQITDTGLEDEKLYIDNNQNS